MTEPAVPSTPDVCGAMDVACVCALPPNHGGLHCCLRPGARRHEWATRQTPHVWCYCFETPEPCEPWIFPDDEHADVCGFARDRSQQLPHKQGGVS